MQSSPPSGDPGLSVIGFGQSAPRREDDRFLIGRGLYTDDVRIAGTLRAVFVRSPYPSALVRSIDAEAALAITGVVAVLTGADMAADGVKDRPAAWKLPQGDGSFAEDTPRPFLVRDRVRFGGEPVAVVIADTLANAQEAADLVNVDFEDLPSVTDVLAAADGSAPQVWDDRRGNLAYHWRAGDFGQVDAALEASHHVTHLKSRITRVAAMPMEPRNALACIGEDGRPVIYASHQSPHQLRDMLAASFGLEQAGMRVICGDVGGSFGMKFGLQREEGVIFWAARRLRRPVRWVASRTESFLSDEHARDVYITAELGLDANGRFTALRVRYDINVGAYMGSTSCTPIYNFGGIAGVYTTPLIAGEAVGVFTNTQPTTAYRGAGRPDATFAIERIIDTAAAEMGIDPAELRRRNLIPPQAMPYQTPFLFKYDCGDFERNLDKGLALADYAGFPQRRQQSLQAGKLRGIGIAMPIEIAGRAPGGDWAVLRANEDGSVSLMSGSMSVGQGLDTSFSMMVAQRLDLPLEKVKYVQGDTDLVVNGRGNGGSSALILCGTAVNHSVDDLLDKARKLAAAHLEVAREDLQYAHGQFRVVGTDRVVGLGQLAAQERGQAGQDGLAGASQWNAQEGTFPNGCHICEVEVDPETGRVQLFNYVGVEDVGRVLNPMLVEGQVHGGVAQGIGQILMEEIRFDENGQLVTGSFMDYAMPRAADIPPMVCAHLETPTALNPLGVKGVGEAGTVGAMSAAANAICNALQSSGVRHFDMPATPMRVWQALRDAGHSAATRA